MNKDSKILLAHGSGGKLMHNLISELLLAKLSNPQLNELSDSAIIDKQDKGLAFTTDSFVVSPLFFRGGDIGKLAVAGTINDLVVSGAAPLYLSLALIIEEGLEYSLLERVVDSISAACRSSKVKIITGDLKVVGNGACDKLFINTSGIGKIVRPLKLDNIKAGDKIIITGRIAEHGLSIITQRKDIALDLNIKSDCASLDKLLIPILKKSKAIKFMRDPTRGGLATTLNEIAKASNLGISIEESSIPIAEKVRAAGELLGIDPLYVANEGKAILIVEAKSAEKIKGCINKLPQGRFARIIGSVVAKPKRIVVLKTIVGTERILDMLNSQALPRIC